MKMIETYQGYFKEDGRFVSNGLLVKIPAKRRAIVNILEDEMTETGEAVSGKGEHQQKVLDIKQILADALKAENSGLTDTDWDELVNLRFRTNAGLSRVIDL